MATTTKEKEKPTTKEVATTETTNGVSVNGKVLSHADAVKALAEMKTGELDSGYLTFKPGDKKRVIFMGWKKITGIGEQAGSDVEAAVFVTDSGKEQINADAVIRSYFQRQQVGVAREIVCKGENTTKNGTYKTFDIFELNS